ncbi:osm1, partial [Symbiodinium microadriaticum]
AEADVEAGKVEVDAKALTAKAKRDESASLITNLKCCEKVVLGFGVVFALAQGKGCADVRVLRILAEMAPKKDAVGAPVAGGNFFWIDLSLDPAYSHDSITTLTGVKDGDEAHMLDDMAPVLIKIGVLAAVQFLFAFGWQTCLAWAAAKQVLFCLDVSWYDEHEPAGVAARLETDIANVYMLFGCIMLATWKASLRNWTFMILEIVSSLVEAGTTDQDQDPFIAIWVASQKDVERQVIVVGGGLAGMSAANTVIELGGRSLLLDKSSFCGGNSTKATSGINGAGTKTQKGKSIPDNAEIFIADTLKGGAKKPELAKVLCANSAADVDWLVDKFDLDLSLVARLGGHSQPRTHRGKERFPGMTITYALIQMLEKVAEKTNRARIITKAEVFKLLQNGSAVVGCEYKRAGKVVKEFGPMVLASGGFGADFGADSLLATYRPDLLHLPTTNGEHCTGDAIKMGEAIGAATIDLEWVQVHPTGLVKPDDPDAKVKFLAAEALRGVGGIVLDANGDRFCNELGRRDYVTGEMWKNKPPFRLCLNRAAADEIIWHAKHYTGRGVMKFYSTGEDLAKDMGVPLQKLVDAHQKHFEAAKKQEKDPDGGPFPAYPSGKTWD